MDSSWVSAGAAVVSVLFAGASLWLSSLSKAARSAAEDAEKSATRKVEAAEQTAEELRRLVDSLSPPPLEAEVHKIKSGQRIWLQNTTDDRVTVAEVLNFSDFVRLDWEGGTPITLPPGAQIEMNTLATMGHPVPVNLHLRLGDGRDVHVPLRPRA